MIQPELILFGCSGVLVDSEGITARVAAEIVTEAGCPITAEDYALRFAGRNFSDILLEIEIESDVPFQASLIARVDKAVERRLRREVRPVGGGADMLAALGVPFCVCSNASSERVEMMLNRTGLLPYFQSNIFVAGAAMSKNGTLSSNLFLHAANQMDANPSNCFVVEDSEHGIHGALAAGMRVIGFSGASHRSSEHAGQLSDAGAETVINRLKDVPEVIAALSIWREND